MTLTPEQMKERQEQLKERARKGLLQHLKQKGGTLSLSEMHDYSLEKYLIQHQAFSQLMEGLVDQGLVSFDQASFTVTLNEAGEKY